MRVSNWFFKWEHHQDHLMKLRGGIVKTKATICFIYDVSASPGGKPLPDALSVAQGIATLSPRDVFNKEVGRKLSLHRALESLIPYMKLTEAEKTISEVRIAAEEMNLRTKQERQAIWEAYRTLGKDTRWGEPLDVAQKF